MDNTKEIISHIKAIGIKFLAVENLRFMHKRNKKFYKEYCNSLFEYYITGLRNDISIGGQWSRLINVFSKDLNCRNYYCGANGGIFCVRSSGRITACHTISAPKFDSLNDFLNSKYFKDGIRRNYLINECRNCEIEGICMGNCRSENESLYKESGCAFHKEMFRNLLSNVIKLKDVNKNG
ncbi:MAG: SPASM domain-containing protein [Candidatus Cloacimonetes bacterium]|nr:SPASM domain-containing protein [Candidatus Cloacimonadota bacterium]